MTWDAAELESGPVPLWHQIAERLRTAIAAGEFRPGDALPSESRINARFGVSRTTARASLDRLKEDGLISRRSGKGSIVLAPRVEQPLNRLSSFGDDMRRRGFAPSYETVSVRRRTIPREAARALGIEPRTEAVRVRRLLKADGWPIGFSDSWISPRVLGPDASPDRAHLDAGSLYAWLEAEHGARIDGGSEIIGATGASARLAAALGVDEGAPLLTARRTCHDANGSPIEHALIHYRPDRYRFHVALVRG